MKRENCSEDSFTYIFQAEGHIQNAKVIPPFNKIKPKAKV